MTRREILEHAAAVLGVMVFFAAIGGTWRVNVLLVAVLAATFLYQLRVGLGWALAAGIAMDALSVTGSGVWIFGFLGASLTVHVLLQRSFPARSVLSALAVGALGVLACECITRTLGSMLVHYGGPEIAVSWGSAALKSIPLQMALGGVLVALIVAVARTRTRRLRNAFLIR